MWIQITEWHKIFLKIVPKTKKIKAKIQDKTNCRKNVAQYFLKYCVWYQSASVTFSFLNIRARALI